MNNESNEKKRKYRLHEKLNKLTVEQSKVSRNKLPLALGISKDTFNKWLGIKIGDKHSIPSNHLAALASYFNCEIKELFNEEIPELNYENIKDLEDDKQKELFNVK